MASMSRLDKAVLTELYIRKYTLEQERIKVETDMAKKKVSVEIIRGEYVGVM